MNMLDGKSKINNLCDLMYTLYSEIFNIDEQKVYYRNVKNNITSTRQVSFINSMGRIYNIYELYNLLYKNEMKDEGFADIIKGMPSSSGLSSSTSSWFK